MREAKNFGSQYRGFIGIFHIQGNCLILFGFFHMPGVYLIFPIPGGGLSDFPQKSGFIWGYFFMIPRGLSADTFS